MAGGPTGAQIAGAGVAAAGAAAVIAPKPPITNSLGMKFVYIEPGEFDMGSPSDERNRDGDETRHRVKITKGFYICTTETTQEQWNELIRQNRSFWKGDKLPVSEVSWDDAVEFCRRLTDHESKEKRKYRLPTEAEWEYASRAGSTGAFPDGVSLDDLTWYFENSGERYHDVGTKRPNAWGLYDTYGNVREWCQDYYGPYPTGEVTDPKGPSTGNGRVLRGGSWDDIARYCRAAYRSEFSPGDRYNTRGFRVVLEP
jgi:formylglycine-generating enzyme required for sulfatase activity